MLTKNACRCEMKIFCIIRCIKESTFTKTNVTCIAIFYLPSPKWMRAVIKLIKVILRNPSELFFNTKLTSGDNALLIFTYQNFLPNHYCLPNCIKLDFEIITMLAGYNGCGKNIFLPFRPKKL